MKLNQYRIKTYIQWLKHDFLGYLDRWEAEIQQTDGTPGEKNQMCLSRETLEGLRITGVLLHNVHALPQYDYYHYALHVHTYSELDGRANSISTKCERGEVCSDRKVLPGSPGKLLWQAENERGIQ